MIRKLFKIFLSSMFWGRSLYWSSKKKYDKSLQLLELSIKYRGGADIEVLLRKGYLLGALGKDVQAITFLKKSISEIKVSEKISFDEKRYLINYASSIAVVMDRIDADFCFDDEYDKEKISKHYAENFPYSKGNASGANILKSHSSAMTGQ